MGVSSTVGGYQKDMETDRNSVGLAAGLLQRTTRQACSGSFGNHTDEDSFIERWCRQCWSCQQRKAELRPGRAKMHQHLVGAPLERMAVDIMGPLPTTANGIEYHGSLVISLSTL